MGARVFTIPSHAPFVDRLAAGLLREAGGAPEALARMLVLLPTRRACRALREAFLRAGGGAPLLLPRLRPIGDADADELALTAGGDLDGAAPDLAPPIGGMRRALLLAEMVRRRDPALPPDQAVWLAQALAQLIDQAATERIGFGNLASLVPGELAAHWQATVEFLKLATELWPAILAEEGALDPAAWRDALLRAEAEAWRKRPPDFPVIAAGSTGSIPATADLLKVVAGLPKGAVIVPGLDTALDDEAWQAAALAPSHAQHGLARLLLHLGVARTDVAEFHAAAGPAAAPPLAARLALVSAALKPAEAAGGPLGHGIDAAALVADWRDGIAYAECAHPREEAATVALALRHALETPGQTAALITPDRDLARRVAVALRRWGIAIDDSAGTPLAATPPAVFLRLLIGAAAAGWAPVPLLSLLKHPLAAGGRDPGAFRALARRLELRGLRGRTPAPGWDGILAAHAAWAEAAKRPPDPAVVEWVAELKRFAAPLDAAFAQPALTLPVLARAHLEAAEALAATAAESGAARLWTGEAGEALAAFLAELGDESRDSAAVAPADYPGLFDALMAGATVRPRQSAHPRLAILGPLEARLQHHDVTVLGGLNEGTWPRIPEPDPWMSRPMRQAFGLPFHERRIGLSAHDFAQALAAPRVLLTRARRAGGQPMPASRWLLRIEAALRSLGLVGPGAPALPNWKHTPWQDWARALDAPTATFAETRPLPRPPLSARPRRLSVTDIEKLIRDPYVIYARRILNLRKLDPLEPETGPADFGTAVHAAVAAALGEWPAGPLPRSALATLLRHGATALAEAFADPGAWAFWQPRFRRMAEWFVAEEDGRRGQMARSFAEIEGSVTFPSAGGPFELYGRADRVIVGRDGGIAIVDYKTGAPPAGSDVVRGLYPQLPLEAAMAQHDGFEGVFGTRIAALEFWRLSGRDEGGEIKRAGGKNADPNDLAAEAWSGLLHLIAHFDDPATAYAARPRARHALRADFNDYAHLAREAAWLEGEAQDP